MHDLFKERLADWKNRGLWRERQIIDSPQQPELFINQQVMLSFCSNDYLGLATHPEIVEAMNQSMANYAAGSGSSAMVSGHGYLLHQLEESFAAWMGHQKALHFSTGYMANLGVVQALTIPDTAIFSDALNHASLIDGIRLAKPKELLIYRHLDLQHLESLLKESTCANKWIITDGVFSMDGDVAPLDQMLSLAERYDAYIYVDDAHGFGVLGDKGRGVLEHFSVSSERILYMATLGKAMGVFGALVSGESTLIDWVLQQARTYIFTTAVPPALAGGALKALEILQYEPNHLQNLKNLIQYLSQEMMFFGECYRPSLTAIHPLIIGSNDQVMLIMHRLKEEGVWVPAIRPPTVPDGTARLRISLSAKHDINQLDRLLIKLKKFI